MRYALLELYDVPASNETLLVVGHEIYTPGKPGKGWVKSKRTMRMLEGMVADGHATLDACAQIDYCEVNSLAFENAAGCLMLRARIARELGEINRVHAEVNEQCNTLDEYDNVAALGAISHAIAIATDKLQSLSNLIRAFEV